MVEEGHDEVDRRLRGEIKWQMTKIWRNDQEVGWCPSSNDLGLKGWAKE